MMTLMTDKLTCSCDIVKLCVGELICPEAIDVNGLTNPLQSCVSLMKRVKLTDVKCLKALTVCFKCERSGLFKGHLTSVFYSVWYLIRSKYSPTTTALKWSLAYLCCPEVKLFKHAETFAICFPTVGVLGTRSCLAFSHISYPVWHCGLQSKVHSSLPSVSRTCAAITSHRFLWH